MAPIVFSSPARPRIGGMPTFLDVIAAFTPTTARRHQVGGRKTSKLFCPQFHQR
jgi:hypothetical protein